MVISYLLLLLVAVVCAFVVVRVLLYRTGLVYIVKKWWGAMEDCFHVYQSFKVPEINEDTMQENHLYRKVSEYLNSLTSIEDSDFTNLITGKKSNEIVLKLDPNQKIEDRFLGAKLVWVNEEKGEKINGRNLVLKIRKADKRRILRPYLQHIHTVADEVEQRRRDLKLYINIYSSHQQNGRWKSIPFNHPSTFETIAMEADLKAKVKSDLESFLKAKQYYHRLGRVWKRSYLLYGPSGTGKTSFVAAMANFLGYDVYDLDLSKVSDDSDLKILLLQTTAKSVIVIEDLDRFLIGKSTAVTLSGVLSFMDGLLSSCVITLTHSIPSSLYSLFAQSSLSNSPPRSPSSSQALTPPAPTLIASPTHRNRLQRSLYLSHAARFEKDPLKKMAEGEEDLPRDAKIVKSLLKSMGVEDYEPRVIHQFLELWYRYVVDVLTDSQVYSEHAGKGAIDSDDVKLAIQSKVNFSFSQPPPREVLLELARNRNKVPLPRSIAGPASVPLPPEQDTLISPNYQLALPRRQSAQAAEEIEEDDEAIDPAAVTTTPSQQEQKTTDVPPQSQRVSFPLKRTK